MQRAAPVYDAVRARPAVSEFATLAGFLDESLVRAIALRYRVSREPARDSSAAADAGLAPHSAGGTLPAADALVAHFRALGVAACRVLELDEVAARSAEGPRAMLYRVATGRGEPIPILGFPLGLCATPPRRHTHIAPLGADNAALLQPTP